jgi:putative endonuclease
MEYFVYILYSPSHNRTYVGQTNNLVSRLSYHNSGKVKSTKPFRPWVLIHSESFSSRSDAMKKEKWFKSTSGRKKISELLNNLSSF